ncbi:MAG: beta-glucosidase BglX [Bacteroidetes bacterium]|nr:beta-glucosidase BglX [Bacteroidota bacterium]
MKKTLLTLAALLSLGATMAQKPKAGESKETYLQNLLNKMTLDEKLGQLTLFTSDMASTGPVMRDNYQLDIKSGKCGNIFNAYGPQYTRKLQSLAMHSRLKIPLLFGYDVIHGHKTIFPIPLGESCAWDTLLSEQSARIAAVEASADGLHWTYSPMVDIARDPRWGRVAEGSGEDPVLGSAIGRAKVRGYQGTSLKDKSTILSCVKHFALYGAPVAGRDYNTVDMSKQQMFNVYLPPYKAAIDAGAASVMSSFNDINGIPATANSWLMNDLLRKQWGFKGFVVTDYTSINEMVYHGNVANEYEAGIAALKAGIDMDMQGAVFYNYLKKALDENKVSMTDIDQAVLRVLGAKWDLGLFEDPYLYCDPKRAAREIMSKENLDKAEEIAEASVVLLKNKGNILPLQAKGTIAFIGPMVKNKRDLIGNWSGAGNWTQSTSLWEVVEPRMTAAGAKALYAMGANVTNDTNLIKKMNIQEFIDKRSQDELENEAMQIAMQADIVVMALGESEGMSGEAASRSDITLPGTQLELLKKIHGLGKPVILLLSSGRPLALSWEDQHVDAILQTWFLGTRSGKAIGDILFGDAIPTGKLTMTFPRSVGQVPIYYAAKSTGRPFDPNQKYTSKYLDIENTPLYPFGYGLSYTTYAYSNFKLSKNTLAEGEYFDVQVDVKNTGNRAGKEIVQLYTRDLVGSSTRPMKELKRFAKIALEPGETKTVRFSLSSEDLKFFNYDLNWVLEPGKFKVMVGPNSTELLEAELEVK